jgi:hypothetical protein
MSGSYLYPSQTIAALNKCHSDDLIYDLSLVPNWLAIPYVLGGLLDRIKQNFNEHTREVLLPDQNEYHWFRKPSPSPHIIRFESKAIGGKDKSLELALYSSAANIEIQAFTWINLDGEAIKPIKIIKHDWYKYKCETGETIYKCDKCEMRGRGKYFLSNQIQIGSGIRPDRLLTCEQEIVRDIVE